MASGVFSRLMSAITPRNDNYFVLFNNLAESAVTGSKVLAMMTAVNEANKFEEHFAEIRLIESQADEYTKEILISLHKTYITPFDRREIRELAMALDDIIDYMEAIPQSAKIYGHSNFTPEMVALGQILLRASEKVRDAVTIFIIPDSNLESSNNSPTKLSMRSDSRSIRINEDSNLSGCYAQHFSCLRA